jgi:hypothetical protein
VLTGKGSHTGSVKVSFNILPKNTKVAKATAGKKQVKVSWKKVSSKQKATSYQLHYRVKGASTWKVRTVSAKAKSATVKKLTRGKQYQFQLRTVRTVSGKKYCSTWSAMKTTKKVK